MEGDENVLKLDCSDGDGYITPRILRPLTCTFQKGELYRIIWYLNKATFKNSEDTPPGHVLQELLHRYQR